jgi:hypothetical protein
VIGEPAAADVAPPVFAPVEGVAAVLADAELLVVVVLLVLLVLLLEEQAAAETTIAPIAMTADQMLRRCTMKPFPPHRLTAVRRIAR